MTATETRSQGYAIGGGNVFSDRLFSEFPFLKGEEISEEEAREFERRVAAERGDEYVVGAAGDVRFDRLYPEHGALIGEEVSER